MDGLPEKVRIKCLAKLELLERFGHELRRPYADYLRDGIYELRARHGNVHYRMLYFFCGRGVVVTHGFVKRGRRVPPEQIELAIRRKEEYEAG